MSALCCCCAGGGGFCIYCSECVGAAGCNPVLCGSCITGSIAPPVECVSLGSDTGICGNPCITPCLIPNSNIPDNGITNLSDPCNPCSPTQCGTTTQPPCTLPYCNPDSINSASCAGTRVGGGSGAGTAGSSGGSHGGGGGGASPNTSALSQAMNRLGATLASLLGGGKTISSKSIVPGLKTSTNPNMMSSNTFGLVVVIVGILLIFIAFGHKEDRD